MPLLSHRHIKKSRKPYVCDDCALLIPVGSSYHYLYGMMEVNDKPYPLRICERCQTRFERATDKIPREQQ